MKSFKTLLSEVAEPKSAEEQRFKDQHTYEVIKHPVALDSQFTGEITPGQNTKDKGKRAADQKGDAAYDKAYSKHGDGSTKLVAKESVEQLDEIEAIKSKIKDMLTPKARKNLQSAINHHDKQADKKQKEADYLTRAHEKKPAGKVYPYDKPEHAEHMAGVKHNNDAANHLDNALQAHKAGNKKDLKKHMRSYHSLNRHNYGRIRSYTPHSTLSKVHYDLPHTDNVSGAFSGHVKGIRESINLDESGMTDAQKMTFDKLYKKMNNGPEHKALKQKHGNMVKADDAFHALVKKKAMGEAKELTDEELSAKQKKIDLNKNGKVDGHDLAMLRAKKNKTEGKKAFKDLRGEGLMSALKKPVTQTGPDGRTRTVMKTTRNITKDDRGYDKIRTNESDELLDEGMKFKKGNLKLKDRSQVMVTKEDADKLNKLMGGLDRNNLKRMEATAVKDKKSFNEILSFAREAT